MQVTIPAGRAWVAYQVTTSYSYFVGDELTNTCQNSPADCGSFSAQVKVSIPGQADAIYSASGSAAAAPTDPGWVGCYTGGSSSTFLTQCRFNPVIVNVGSATKAGSITATLTGSSSGNPKYPPIAISVQFYGDSRLQLQQLLRNFRPRNATEYATADCDNHYDDCYPYVAGYILGIPAPLIGQDGWSIPAIFKMTIEPPAYMNGAWLPGSSTNFGAATDTATFPDYIFEASQNDPSLIISNGLSIQTAPAPPGDNACYGCGLSFISITSRDYGGVANVRLTVTLGTTANGANFGVAIPLDEVLSTLPDGQSYGVIPPPNTKCGSGVFASLPVDYDCNGIADWWEDQNSPQTDANGNPIKDQNGNILHLPPDWDQEPGYNGTTVGDGYSVHDEYRWFHYIDDAVDPSDPNYPTGHPRWTSTDPIKTQDVFFWDSFVAPKADAPDPCASPQYSPAAPTQWSTLRPNCVTTALRGMLAQQTVTASGQSFMAFRRVNAVQANAVSSQDPTQGVTQFNKNTRYSTQAFAVVYANNADQLNNPAQCDASPPHQGTLASAGTFSNDGSIINLNLPQIIACAYISRQSAQAAPYPQDTYLQRVVAHETAHKFSLYHFDRFVTGGTASHVGATFPYRLQDLPFNSYYVDDTQSATLYLRYNEIAYSALDARLNTFTPSVLHDSLEWPMCLASRQIVPASPDSVYQLQFCIPSSFPAKQGPVPTGNCRRRFATEANSNLSLLPYLEVHTAALDRLERGRPAAGMDMMSIFSPFVTQYTFDQQCELPHLRLTPLAN